MQNSSQKLYNVEPPKHFVVLAKTFQLSNVRGQLFLKCQLLVVFVQLFNFFSEIAKILILSLMQNRSYFFVDSSEATFESEACKQQYYIYILNYLLPAFVSQQ